ncbi:MAG: HAD family phosphatase [Ignavibacteriaceae bacterium]|jgi:putative hydrolase of the HAD superfamily|nr:HAD family phosphatase [Ignavibacteriaceae bacterium]MCW8961400.1 HAD family phosphatase [Ignavibacteriaceae bacterium]MCW8994273.1 HAD family phosphatase [Psychromonas sp.]
MKNRKYSAIVFDLGNVLIPFDFKKALIKLDQVENGLGDRFNNFFKANYNLHREFEKGKISDQDFIKRMLTIVDHKIDESTFCKYYADIFSLNEDVISLLPVLKKNYKLFLLSNTDSIHKKYGWEKYEFLKNFDRLILSFEVGSVKPEEKIYRTVEKASGFSSQEHLFIDDIQEYVDGSKNIGWDAVQFVNYQKLLNDLKERNISF